MLEHLFAPTLSVQGTLVDIKGIGVLIEGPPAIGKSEAALALVMRGYSLVADDFVVLRRHEGQAVLGTSSPATRYHMELRGLGIVHIPSLYGVNAVVEEKRLDLIVTLRPAGEVPDPPAPSERQVLGVSVPQVTIPVSPGRDLAPIIELAGMNERLKRLGHDAAKELDEKLVTAMMERMSGS